MSDERPGTPLFNESPTATLLVDREGLVVDANPVALKSLARARTRVVGEPLLGFLAQEDRQRAKDLFQLVLSGRPQSWTARIKRGDGVPRAQSLRAVPLGNGNGTQGILVFSRDVSAGGEGRPDTVQLQTLLENLPEQFVVVLDRGARIRYASGLGRTHYLDNIGLLGEPYEALLADEPMAGRTLAAMLEDVGKGQAWAGVQWHLRKDGTSFPAQVFATPHLEPRTGRVVGTLLVGRDASLVQRWRERAELAEPLATVGKLVASIGTELEAGLARMRTIIDQAGGEEGLGGDGLAGLRDEVAAMDDFVAKLDQFSRKEDSPREEVDLAHIVEKSLEGVRERIAEVRARVKTVLPEGLPPVFAEREGLTRVVASVLENALDALEEDPEGRLEVHLSRKSKALLLKISNTGSRVRPEWLKQIFDPFFTTRPGKAGLGLAVARGVILSHSGRIWADAPDDEILNLTIEIPLEPPETRIPFRPVPLTLARSRSILVVDDDDAIRATLRMFLEKVGFEVREAWSGRSALAQLTGGTPPELVITDLRMDDGSGYWFLEALEQDFPKLVSRTIIITGDSRAEAAEELANKTGCPLVRKPFELPRLLEVIDEVSLRR